MAEPVSHPPYFSTIHSVREVALTCRASLDFWRDRLKQERLYPCNIDGSAEITIITIESRFMGILFREMSFSIAIAHHENAPQPEGSFLIHAYNSRWLFALAERLFFVTPYYPATIHVDEKIPASIRLEQDSQVLIQAAMSDDTPAAQHDNDVWEDAIYLPSMKGDGTGTKVFYARLSGARESYPFQPGDKFQLTPSPQHPVFRLLVDSGCTGQAWHIRKNAVHARSKSYDRLSS